MSVDPAWYGPPKPSAVDQITSAYLNAEAQGDGSYQEGVLPKKLYRVAPALGQAENRQVDGQNDGSAKDSQCDRKQEGRRGLPSDFPFRPAGGRRQRGLDCAILQCAFTHLFPFPGPIARAR